MLPGEAPYDGAPTNDEWSKRGPKGRLSPDLGAAAVPGLDAGVNCKALYLGRKLKRSLSLRITLQARAGTEIAIVFFRKTLCHR